MNRGKNKNLPEGEFPGYAKRPPTIKCWTKNPTTGNVLKSFCENGCREREKGCRPKGE